jgi:hypothetical protein
VDDQLASLHAELVGETGLVVVVEVEKDGWSPQYPWLLVELSTMLELLGLPPWL